MREHKVLTPRIEIKISDPPGIESGPRVERQGLYRPRLDDATEKNNFLDIKDIYTNIAINGILNIIQVQLNLLIRYSEEFRLLCYLRTV